MVVRLGFRGKLARGDGRQVVVQIIWDIGGV